MARMLSRNLIRASETLTLTKKSLPLPSFLFSSRRAKSGGPEKAELIEIDLGPDTESESESGSGAEVEIHVGVRRLEDAIQAIIVRRSRPAWLPFIPGSSYWVPPRGKRAMGVVELIGRASSSRSPPPLSEEEVMSLTSFRGWPSSKFFLDSKKVSISDGVPRPVKSSSNVVAQSDDEE
ncbi:uncharacterized protein M6B38_361620 [Iris pallida]|uniref:Uncharacterized protein n=1 Tax=Iris pallida TaxID=29817 RepID=A0AAX6GJY8_IRIPA|nr:uncharacterized protein M6B38_361620 [Iris pallida]